MTIASDKRREERKPGISTPNTITTCPYWNPAQSKTQFKVGKIN